MNCFIKIPVSTYGPLFSHHTPYSIFHTGPKVQYKSALQACEDETGLDPDIARALFDSQDGGTSEAPTTIHSDVILTNKEKLFDLAYAEFKSPWSKIANHNLLMIGV